MPAVYGYTCPGPQLERAIPMLEHLVLDYDNLMILIKLVRLLCPFNANDNFLRFLLAMTAFASLVY